METYEGMYIIAFDIILAIAIAGAVVSVPSVGPSGAEQLMGGGWNLGLGRCWADRLLSGGDTYCKRLT
jgi:hypothetical protein